MTESLVHSCPPSSGRGRGRVHNAGIKVPKLHQHVYIKKNYKTHHSSVKREYKQCEMIKNVHSCLIVCNKVSFLCKNRFFSHVVNLLNAFLTWLMGILLWFFGLANSNTHTIMYMFVSTLVFNSKLDNGDICLSHFSVWTLQGWNYPVINVNRMIHLLWISGGWYALCLFFHVLRVESSLHAWRKMIKNPAETLSSSSCHFNEETSEEARKQGDKKAKDLTLQNVKSHSFKSMHYSFWFIFMLFFKQFQL